MLCSFGIAHSQSITVNSVSSSVFCWGEHVSVSFTVTGDWGHNNAFTLQISDSSGSFNSGFQNLNAVQDTVAGTFTLNSGIPALPASGNYRFRILAAVPFVTATSDPVSIAAAATPAVGAAVPRTLGATLDYRWVVGSPMDVLVATSERGPVAESRLLIDFGEGASPATATVHISNGETLDFLHSWVTYETPGRKTITITNQTPLPPVRCTTPEVLTAEILDCSIVPPIPHDAVVIDTNTVLRQTGGRTYWVNPGIRLSNPSNDTIFAEPGSTISNAQHCFVCLKTGSVLASGSSNDVFYGDGVSIGTSTVLSLHCPTLQFDYTNAPPNKIVTNAVPDDIRSAPITMFPNPTTGTVSLRGLPLTDLTISVTDMLGATEIEQNHIRSTEATLDLSGLAPGMYYIRISTPTTVVTKKLVRQ